MTLYFYESIVPSKIDPWSFDYNSQIILVRVAYRLIIVGRKLAQSPYSAAEWHFPRVCCSFTCSFALFVMLASMITLSVVGAHCTTIIPFESTRKHGMLLACKVLIRFASSTVVWECVHRSTRPGGVAAIPSCYLCCSLPWVTSVGTFGLH